MKKAIIVNTPDRPSEGRTIGPNISINTQKLEKLFSAIERQKQALADLKDAIRETEACKHDLINTSR